MFNKKCIITLLIIFILSCLPCFAADITLRWDANSETDLAGYKLYYKVGTPDSPYDNTEDIPLGVLIDPDNPEFTLADLDDSYIYFLVLTAYDDEVPYNESGYSNEVRTFYISTPQDGFVVDSSNYTAFNVSGRGANGKAVNIYVNGAQIETTTAGAGGMWSVDVDFTGITNGAIDLFAMMDTSTTTITSNTVLGTLNVNAPATPTGLSATVISDNQIDLNWNEVINATSYNVYRDSVSIGNVTVNGYSDTSVIPGINYTYTVTAIDSGGRESGHSSSASAMTNDTTPPSTPQNLEVLTITSTSIELEWEKSTDDVGVIGYDVYRDGQYCNTVLGSISDFVSYIDANLLKSTLYSYTVLAYDAVINESNHSNIASATTLAGGSTGGGSSDGCFIGSTEKFIGSTEKIENLLIKIAAGFSALFIFVMSIIGLEFIITMISKLNSDIKTIVVTSSLIVIFVIIAGNLAWGGIPVTLVATVSLFLVGICNILLMSGKTLFRLINRGFIKC